MTARVLSWLSVSWTLPAIAGAAPTPALVAVLGTSACLWTLIAAFTVSTLSFAAFVRPTEAKHPSRAYAS